LRFSSRRDDHDPALRGRMTEHFWVAEIGALAFEYWIVGRLCPGAPFVVRKRQALALLFTVTYFEAVRENGHKPGFVGKETAGVVPIDDAASRPYFAQFVGPQRDRPIFPANQIAANGVTPMFSRWAIRLILIEQVPQIVEKHQAVGIVHPPGGRRVMRQWARCCRHRSFLVHKNGLRRKRERPGKSVALKDSTMRHSG